MKNGPPYPIIYSKNDKKGVYFEIGERGNVNYNNKNYI